MSGDEPVEANDFMLAHNTMDLPFTISDSTARIKETDSSLISYKIFTQFIPDSVISKVIGKGKPKIYPVGKITVGNDEKYLVSKAVLKNKIAYLLTVFNGSNEFITAMPLLSIDGSRRTQQYSTIDEKYLVTKNVLRNNQDNTLSEGKDVYVYNKDARDFTLIMTDALDEDELELINPIDTLAANGKYAGDYGKGKNNILSIRDATREDRFQFFIHFEKDNGNCTGELKGFAIMSDANTAVYRQPGDPCVLEFKFSKNAVSVNEMAGCGNRRGLDCSFNGSYPRKKTIAKK